MLKCLFIGNSEVFHYINFYPFKILIILLVTGCTDGFNDSDLKEIAELKEELKAETIKVRGQLKWG
jgi:hypothetical protein